MNLFKKIFFKFIRHKQTNILSTNNIIFLLIILSLIIICSPSSLILNWIGLFLAMFSTMANDSIQTLGTFLSSNRKISWWRLCIYISILFIITTIFGWTMSGGFLDFGRLKDIPYQHNFKIIYLIAPILLMSLTYNKIPASTTFMILSVFSAQNIVTFMLVKTFLGYILGFIISFFLWNFLFKYFKKIIKTDDADTKKKKWRFFQWASTGLLWMTWLTQNTVNIVVYIPRLLNVHELLLFLFLGVAMIGFIFYNKGGPIQEFVNKKTDINNTYSSTMVNLSFAFVILIISMFNNIPMATTWIFIGILAGRELSIAKNKNKDVELIEQYKNAQQIIIKDLISASLGITISLIFSMINNHLL